jgi:hypothetical protein
MQGPPPPWFFITIFPVMAISAGIVIRSIGSTVMRLRAAKQQALSPPAPDPRMAQMQAEIEDLRTQVERLSAAQSFYAQLGAGSAPAHAALPSEAGAPLS